MKNRIILFVGITLLSATQASLMSATAYKPGSLEAAQAETKRIQKARAAEEARNSAAIDRELAEVARAKALSLQPGFLGKLTADTTDRMSTETLPPPQLPALKGSRHPRLEPLAARPHSAASTNPDLLMEYSQQVLATRGNGAPVPVSSPLSASTDDSTPTGMRRIDPLCSPTFMSPSPSEVQSVPTSSPSADGISSPFSGSKSKLGPLGGRASASSGQRQHAIPSNSVKIAAMALAELGKNDSVTVSEELTDSSPRELEADYEHTLEPQNFVLTTYVDSADHVGRLQTSPVPTHSGPVVHPSPQKSSSVENSPQAPVLAPAIRNNISDKARGKLSFAGESDASSLLGSNPASEHSEQVLAGLVSSSHSFKKRSSQSQIKLPHLSEPAPAAAPAPSNLLPGIGRATAWATGTSFSGSLAAPTKTSVTAGPQSLLAAEDASASSGSGMLAPRLFPMSTPSPEQLVKRAAKKEAILKEREERKKKVDRYLRKQAGTTNASDDEEATEETVECPICTDKIKRKDYAEKDVQLWHTDALAGMHAAHISCYKRMSKKIPTQCPICRVDAPRTSTDSPARALHLLLTSPDNKGRESAARDIRKLRLAGASVSPETLLAIIKSGDHNAVEQHLNACILDDAILNEALFRAIKYSKTATDDRFVKIAEILLEHGASTAVIDGSGLTVFMVAARFSSPQMLAMLFRHTIVDLETALNLRCTEYGYTALMYAAKYSTDVNVAQALITAGTDVTLQIKKATSREHRLNALGLAKQRTDTYGPTMATYLAPFFGTFSPSPTRSASRSTPSKR